MWPNGAMFSTTVCFLLVISRLKRVPEHCPVFLRAAEPRHAYGENEQVNLQSDVSDNVVEHQVQC